ncbi:DMT family transporter [Sneathiella limimaris]|uniref:DMT family transporter n=1 Tax=Sneathiella limimaris TaxID=1964213 RepID=UPI00146BD835|nr:DMT family transporter [Sneathiella limimaris]
MPTKRILGFAAITAIVFMWSGWIVTTRFGAQSALTIYDITLLRFGVSSIFVLPVALYYRPWRSLGLKKSLITSQLAGIPYVLAVCYAFKLAPAAHGGIFMNGSLPAITLFLGWIWFKEHPNRVQLLGGLLITIGASITLFGSSDVYGQYVWVGDLLFLLSGLFFALYMVVSKLWLLTPTQILFCSSIVNCALFLPVWYFFLPSGFSEASFLDIALQTVYQGMIATLIGLLLVAFAVRQIGAPTAAAFMSGVPSIAAILGFLLLGEAVNIWVWVSIFLLTPGIILVSIWSQDKYKRKALPN